jgi:hypothetical protein
LPERKDRIRNIATEELGLPFGLPLLDARFDTIIDGGHEAREDLARGATFRIPQIKATIDDLRE